MSFDVLGDPPTTVLVAAGVLVRRGVDLLMQRRGDDGTWGLPGGGLAPGETLEQAARRELLEETGLSAGVLTLRDIYSGPEFVVSYPDGLRAFVVGATYETDDYTGVLTPDADGETVELGWWPTSGLPADVNDYTRTLLRRVGLPVAASKPAGHRPEPSPEGGVRGRVRRGPSTDRWERSDWWGVVLDCPDPPALAAFYSALLGWPIWKAGHDGAAVDAEEGVGYLAFQREPQYVRPTWPATSGAPQMMMHLDIEVADLVAAVEHALELGATLPEHQPQDDVRVLLDPAGHPFCLYT